MKDAKPAKEEKDGEGHGKLGAPCAPLVIAVS